MSYTLHNIDKYSYSYTLTNNDVAAKLSLWKAGTNNNNSKIADIFFVYDGQTVPAANIQADQQYAMMYMPLKSLAGIIDLLRNENPLVLTINPPFAFLGTNSLEPAGDGEPHTIFRPRTTTLPVQ